MNEKKSENKKQKNKKDSRLRVSFPAEVWLTQKLKGRKVSETEW